MTQQIVVGKIELKDGVLQKARIERSQFNRLSQQADAISLNDQCFPECI